jgi:2-desacetyl-2-hydroxyethyl bacteriochlorophyllide A dehydrogenase
MIEARAIVFPAPHKVEIVSYELPEIQPDEILIETEYSGVSQGTELWALQGVRPELRFPTVPGYQSIGKVSRVGSRVLDFLPGQRVMAKNNRLSANFPETWMGAHASHLITREAIPVANECDPIAAAITALTAVSLRGLHMIDINVGDTVVVIGQGLVGQASAQLARLRGAFVIATDVMAFRLAVSQKNSADRVVNSQEKNLQATVQEWFPEGVDAVIDTTGRSDLFASCIDLLRWEGQLLLQGWYPKPVSFDFHATHLKKPRVAITCGFDFDDAAICLDLLKQGKLRLRELVSHLVPVGNAPNIYPKLAARDPAYLGVVFDWTK